MTHRQRSIVVDDSSTTGSDHSHPLAGAVAEVARAELAELAGEGTLAVIVPDAREDQISAGLPEAVPGTSPEALDAPMALLTVAQCKGLEFDRVVIADPQAILDQSPNGGRDLYVALTRATHRLVVVHEGELPSMLARLK